MTQDIGGRSQSRSGQAASSDSPSTTDVAREETVGVGRTAVDTGEQVAQTAAQQAKQVASETGRQARDLLNEGLEQVRNQAGEGQKKAAAGLHTVADQLHEMAESSSSSGVASDLTRQAAQRAHDAASWLEAREPAELLDEVRNFARRRPGLFLAGSALAGILVGRLTKGAVTADRGGSGPDGSTGQAGRHAQLVSEPVSYPATTAPTVTPQPPSGPAIPPTGAAVPPGAPGFAYDQQPTGEPLTPPGAPGQPSQGSVRP
jgi:hypothetical protein